MTETAARVQIKKVLPGVYQAMRALDAAAATGTDKALAELVRIRASQLNGCAHCLDMHAGVARAGGETERRIFLLPAWRESGSIYSEREQAALALTEAVTLLADNGVPDEVYERAAKHFPDTELAHLISLIIAINAWNRIAVTTGLMPGD